MSRFNLSIAQVVLLGLLLGGSVAAQEQPRQAQSISVSDAELPYNQQPIGYSTHAPDDAISRLRQRIDRGTVTLTSKGEQGVLRDLLQALDIPVASQLLVFSKSSANARFISPQTPRAIYFNDEVYVGWVPGSPMIEISAIDPQVGGTFYHLKQDPAATEPAKSIGEPAFQRDESCLLCHISRTTLRVPGHLVRSFTTDSEGQLRTGWSRITHETVYENRWAGWYVTGGAGGLKHLGNAFGEGAEARRPPSDGTFSEAELAGAARLNHYLSPTSDVVPHLVLDHQAHGHNLITRLNYEARLGRPVTAADPLLRYMLFLDEPLLPDTISKESVYVKWFESRGPRDSRGRSLREFDLQTRLFKYRLSYLIYAPSFDALPPTVRTEFLHRLKEWLITTDATHPASRLPLDERQAILEIVRETKTGLPVGW